MTIPINKDPDTEYKNEFMFGYTLKEVPFYVFKFTTVCNLQRDKVTFNKLKFLK